MRKRKKIEEAAFAIYAQSSKMDQMFQKFWDDDYEPTMADKVNIRAQLQTLGERADDLSIAVCQPLRPWKRIKTRK